MTRYLKSASMKGLDGGAVKMPFCCINCKKNRCKVPCDEYADEMKDQKCSRLEMEFGIHDGWWDSLRKIIIQIILAVGLVIAGCNLSMNMKDISLCDLEYKSKLIEERFTTITNSLCKLEVTASNTYSSVDDLSVGLSASSNCVANLKSELSGLQSEIALCSNAVHHVWWWWK